MAHIDALIGIVTDIDATCALILDLDRFDSGILASLPGSNSFLGAVRPHARIFLHAHLFEFDQFKFFLRVQASAAGQKNETDDVMLHRSCMWLQT